MVFVGIGDGDGGRLRSSRRLSEALRLLRLRLCDDTSPRNELEMPLSGSRRASLKACAPATGKERVCKRASVGERYEGD
jgi:hypothetical protein